MDRERESFEQEMDRLVAEADMKKAEAARRLGRVRPELRRRARGATAVGGAAEDGDEGAPASAALASVALIAVALAAISRAARSSLDGARGWA